MPVLVLLVSSVLMGHVKNLFYKYGQLTPDLSVGYHLKTANPGMTLFM
jgi:hypothetical protein